MGPTERDTVSGRAVSREGLDTLYRLCAQVVPDLPLGEVIRSFAALRPNPREVREREGVWRPADRSISGFTILEEDGLISLLGIKTPGLTCALPLGEHAAALAARFLGSPGRNPRYDPSRRGIRRVRGLDEEARSALIRENPDFGEVVCRCRDVTKGEILEAVRRGPPQWRA